MNGDKKIENVIFDFGNVLVKWDVYGALISRYSPNLIGKFRINGISGFEEANVMCDLGEPLEKAVGFIRENYGQPWAEMMEWYMDHFSDSISGEVPGSRQLVQDLKDAGLHVFGLSNWSDRLFERAIKDLPPVIFMMEDRLVSGYVHERKPARAIFEMAISKFKISPASSVFIDDKLENVEAARGFGLKAIQFLDPCQIRFGLKEMGIQIPGLEEGAN